MEEGKAENLTESLLGEEARSVGEVGIKWTSVELWKEESKKLWHIAGPSIFTRVTSYSMNIVTQAFAGHLGDLELASISIGNTVVLGFNFGLIVSCLICFCCYNISVLSGNDIWRLLFY